MALIHELAKIIDTYDLLFAFACTQCIPAKNVAKLTDFYGNPINTAYHILVTWYAEWQVGRVEK